MPIQFLLFAKSVNEFITFINILMAADQCQNLYQMFFYRWRTSIGKNAILFISYFYAFLWGLKKPKQMSMAFNVAGRYLWQISILWGLKKPKQMSMAVNVAGRYLWQIWQII